MRCNARAKKGAAIRKARKETARAEDTSNAAPLNQVRPSYYKGDYVMRIIEDFKLDFLTGTVVKYLLRAGHKDDALIDLRKAFWYLDRKIAQLEKEAQKAEITVPQ